MDNFKKAAAGASSLFNRAKQVDKMTITSENKQLRFDFNITFLRLVHWRKTRKCGKDDLRYEYGSVD